MTKRTIILFSSQENRARISEVIHSFVFATELFCLFFSGYAGEKIFDHCRAGRFNLIHARLELLTKTIFFYKNKVIANNCLSYLMNCKKL